MVRSWGSMCAERVEALWVRSEVSAGCLDCFILLSDLVACHRIRSNLINMMCYIDHQYRGGGVSNLPHDRHRRPFLRL